MSDSDLEDLVAEIIVAPKRNPSLSAAEQIDP
jgi:hypothetical protein